MRTEAKAANVAAEVFCNVIEQTAFMFGERTCKDDLPIAGRPFVQAQMSFHGPLQGTLALAVPRDACLQIAANVLGMEADDPFVAERATDSLKEIVNVTCGHILTSLAGDKPVFDLSIPEVSDLDEAGLAELLADDRTVPFLADDCPVLLRLALRED